MPKRKVKKVYSDPDQVGKYYDPKYVSPGQIEDDELVKTKLITRGSGQRVIKKKGEKRRKVDSFYDYGRAPLNLTDFSTRQENKAKRLRKQADKALDKGKIAKYKNKATKAAIAGALSGDYYMDEPGPSRKNKVEINRIKSDVKDYASQMLNEGVKYNYKNKRQERKDLERNAAAMMKVKKPLKTLEKKEAVNLGKEFYKKTFSDQVRKGYTGEHNMNVAKGSYRMIKGSAPKTITGKPMYGTIGG